MVLTESPYTEKVVFSAGDRCHLNCRSMASSLRFVAYTNVTHLVSSQDYVVPPKDPFRAFLWKTASSLVSLIPDFPPTLQYYEKQHHKTPTSQARCKMCQRNTHFKCTKCNASLHAEHESYCFVVYYTTPTF